MDSLFQYFAPQDRFDQFLRISGALTGEAILRYLLFAGIAFLLFYRLFRNRWKSRKIQARYPRWADYRREVTWSLVSILVFALFGYVVFSPWVLPHTRIYFAVEEMGWAYLLASVGLMVLLHDAYFYWAHRLMHARPFYRLFHAVHHRSNNPSPWAAFSFHPLEAIVEAGIIFVIVFLIPCHPLALLGFMVVMTSFNVLGHIGYEFLPRWLTSSRVGCLLNTPTDHNLHHQHHRTNFGLYFRFWDIICGTTDACHDETLTRLQRGKDRKAVSA